MKSLIICDDLHLLNMMNPRSFYLKESLFLVPRASLKNKLSQRGLNSLSGSLVKSPLYKRANLKDVDITIILLEDNTLIGDILKALFTAVADIPVVAHLRKRDPVIVKKYPMVKFIPITTMFNNFLFYEIKDIMIKKRIEKLRSLFENNDKVLILLQHDPDPDAIASALALRTLLGRNKATAPIGSFGKVTRPENLAMLKLLEIELEHLDNKNIKEYQKITMVDVQPSYFGDDLLNDVDAVIDHHPRQKGYKALFKDIKASYGATSTILTEYLLAAGIKIPQRLATALLYGIKTDTFFLDRDVNRADIKAFSYLYPLANNNLMRRIERPELPLDALQSFGKALQKKTITNKILFSHLGEVEREDVIPYLADFCLQVENIEWSVVSGIHDKKITICVRNWGFTKSAGEIVKEAFGELGSAGGHRSMAKAVIPLDQYEKKFGKPKDPDICKYIKKYFTKAIKNKSNNSSN